MALIRFCHDSIFIVHVFFILRRLRFCHVRALHFQEVKQQGGPWAYEPGGWGAAGPQNLGSSIFWAMTKIGVEGVFGVSNVALIHIERAHVNFVLENEMKRIIDIFGSRTDRDRYLF